MKIVFFSLLLFSCETNVVSIESPGTSIQEPSFVDAEAEYPGGRSQLMKYLSDHLKYPQRAIEAELQGKVYLRLVISEKGKASTVEVQRGIADCPECNEEAVRLIKTIAEWIPGKVKDKPVTSYLNVVVPFKLR